LPNPDPLAKNFTPILVLDSNVGFDNSSTNPKIKFPHSFNFILYKAARNPATIPTNPPIPATIIGAPATLTTAGLELVDTVVLLACVLTGALVVAGVDVDGAALVVCAVTVDVGVLETTTEVEAVPEDVVLAETLARFAENDEQRPKPTEAAIRRSLSLQALRRHGVTSDWIAAMPVPHWQASSARAQPAAEMAEVRQGIAQAGSAPKF